MFLAGEVMETSQPKVLKRLVAVTSASESRASSEGGGDTHKLVIRPTQKVMPIVHIVLEWCAISPRTLASRLVRRCNSLLKLHSV